MTLVYVYSLSSVIPTLMCCAVLARAEQVCLPDMRKSWANFNFWMNYPFNIANWYFLSYYFKELQYYIHHLIGVAQIVCSTYFSKLFRSLAHSHEIVLLQNKMDSRQMLMSKLFRVCYSSKNVFKYAFFKLEKLHTMCFLHKASSLLCLISSVFWLRFTEHVNVT